MRAVYMKKNKQMNDLLGFELLLGHYISTGTPEKQAAAIEWGDAVDKLWTVPKPRIIVSEFVKSKKSWEFRVIGGSQVKISSRPDGDNEHRYILRFAGDRGDQVVNAVGTTIADGSWVSAYRPVGKSFDCIIASCCSRENVHWVAYLGAGFESSGVIQGWDFQWCDPLTVTMRGEPSNQRSTLTLQSHSLPSGNNATSVKTVGTCDVSLNPVMNYHAGRTWNHNGIRNDTVHIYRLDGDSLLMPDYNNGWNLHAYGWMIQAAGPDTTGSNKFLQVHHFHRRPFSWIGCRSESGRKRGLGDREIEDCQDYAYFQNPNSRIFGMNKGYQCWAQQEKQDRFVGNDDRSGCKRNSYTGLVAGGDGLLAVYEIG